MGIVGLIYDYDGALMQLGQIGFKIISVMELLVLHIRVQKAARK